MDLLPVEENRKSYTENEVFIEKPVAPPRSKRDKRQSFKGFKEDRQSLFSSDHTTEDGMDLLPVGRTIAFDCPVEGVHKSDIHVQITGPDEKPCPLTIRLNQDGTFTCEFSTNLVGEHSIEIIMKDEQLNVTPNFYTYDSSKIKVGTLPQGYLGLPVEFDIEGKGAGFGNLEIIVNGGRVTSHVHTISNEKFQANFIPHDPGRHRVDVKFNGEKVPNSPWFVEVKDPNTPLLAPMLVAMGGKGGNGKRNGENGHHIELETKTNGFSSNDLSSSLSNNKFSSSTSKLNSEIKQSSLFQQSKKESNLSSSISSSKFESNNFSSSSLKTNGVDDLKKKAVSDYEKTDVGNFSSLNTPSLLLGGSSNTKSSGLEESRNTFSSSTEQLNSGRATYSTTIERSINTGAAYSSLNKPHEARIKGLNNGGSSTMPKSLSSKGVERKASLHAEPLSSRETGTNRTNGTNSLSSNFTKSTSALASSSSSSLQTSSSTYSAVKSSSNYAATSSLSPPKPAPAPPSPKLPSYKGTA